MECRSVGVKALLSCSSNPLLEYKDGNLVSQFMFVLASF
jgi:hypothetical protein